ncbi:MAG: PIN domain-containing protein [Cyanobacteria bacterium J06581_3]
MNLVDTSPLVALIDESQVENHRRCVETVDSLKGPLLTTRSCFTEAMYLVGRSCDWQGQRLLWNMFEVSALLLHWPDSDEYQRMRVLMQKYRDTPMDLADASLVTAAEKLRLNRIFTLDSDFYVYRINDKEAFEVVPRAV